jgi:phospho-N-acetylmuramoyl-pentapeptide-transferase
MIVMLLAAAVAFGAVLMLTPVAIRMLRARAIGQFIQEEVEGHMHKRGTPTMGGLVIVFGVVAGWFVAHIDARTAAGAWRLNFRDFGLPGLLVMLAFVGMGFIGLVDDYLKVRRARNLGLRKSWKLLGQLAIAALFYWGAIEFGVSTHLSFTRPLGLDLNGVYWLWVLVLLTGTANAVNITDGLDGLVSGSAALVFGAFTIMSFWQFRHPDFYFITDGGTEPTLELAIMSAALFGAVLGFLWWNAAPARIFMGDTGSQALGGAMAALALLTNTHLLLGIVGGLYALVTLSVVLQVIAFRCWGKRIFLMAPLHHHFELKGWPEATIIVRFWIIAALSVGLALGVFYYDFIASGGVG